MSCARPSQAGPAALVYSCRAWCLSNLDTLPSALATHNPELSSGFRWSANGLRVTDWHVQTDAFSPSARLCCLRIPKGALGRSVKWCLSYYGPCCAHTAAATLLSVGGCDSSSPSLRSVLGTVSVSALFYILPCPLSFGTLPSLCFSSRLFLFDCLRQQASI